MSAFNAAWFVLKKDKGLGEEPKASQDNYDRRRGAMRGHHRGASVPVEERRRMARTGQIDTSKGVFAPSPPKPKPRTKYTEDGDPMIGDETNPMESPVMRTTEQIGEMEREAEEDMFKSSPFGAAWSMLKEDEKFKPEPSRTEEGEKQHPSTTYGMKTPAMTRKPTASLRTGAVPAQASEEDIEEFMRINSPKDE